LPHDCDKFVHAQTSIMVLPNPMEDRKSTENFDCFTLKEEQWLRVFYSQQRAKDIWISERGSSNWIVDDISA